MKKSTISLVVIVTFVVVGCKHLDSLTNSQIGTVAGGTTGAIVGNVLGKNNKTASTLLGAVAGGWLGNKLGKYLDEKDQQEMSQSTQKAVMTGQTQTWKNDENNTSGSAEVVSEKTETTEVTVPVLKDRVKTVPPLDMIGEPYVASSASNVRGGPGTDYKPVDKLKAGDQVDVIGKVQGKPWMMVGSQQVGSGFVAARLLKKVPVDDRKPVEEQEPVPAEDIEKKTVVAKTTCRTVKQKITLADGTEEEQEIMSCQGPDGWAVN